MNSSNFWLKTRSCNYNSFFTESEPKITGVQLEFFRKEPQIFWKCQPPWLENLGFGAAKTVKFRNLSMISHGQSCLKNPFFIHIIQNFEVEWVTKNYIGLILLIGKNVYIWLETNSPFLNFVQTPCSFCCLAFLTEWPLHHS